MKILVALSRFPWPLEKGDKLRAYYQLKGLAAHHEVHLVCLNDKPVSSQELGVLDFCSSVEVVVLPKWMSMLNVLIGLFDKRPFQAHYFFSKRLRRHLGQKAESLNIDVLYVQLIRLGMNLPEGLTCGKYLDFMDTFSIGMGQRAQSGNWLMRWVARIESDRLKHYEAVLAGKFQGWSVISERDLDALPESIRSAVDVIGNGVGEAFFEPLPKQENRYELVFFGNMGYHPNVESAKYLMEEIVPELKRRGLDLRICLAGARPAPIVQGYASEKVTVTGFMDDIRTVVLQAKLAIAPVIAGQGLQNKLLESMALGLPTLTTPLAHAALPAEDGRDLIVCKDAQSFAESIERLLSDPEYAAEIGRNGRSFVESNYRWEAMNNRLLKGLERLAGMQQAPR